MDTHAGISVVPLPISMRTRRPGRGAVQPPSTPEMAPDAPRLGTSMLPPVAAVANTWASEARTPQTR